MNRDILFRVPVYRESLQEYHADIEHELQVLSAASGFSMEEMPVLSFQKPWKYNRVIGWIELYTSWNKVYADLWFTAAQRVRKKIGKIVYESSYEEYEIADSNLDTNEEIRQAIRNFLLETYREYWPKLNRYYLDVSALESIIDFVDFCALIEARAKKQSDINST